MFTYEDYAQSAQYIKAKIGDFQPKVLMILGSGLGFLGDEVQNPIYVSYGDVPNMRSSTVEGHKGRFVFGTLADTPVMIMQGRIHIYEGYSAAEVAYPVRVARLLGVESLIVTNAAGAVNTAFNVGDLMLITDHIKLMGESPIAGANVEQLGPRFCDMSYTYTPQYLQMAKEKAAACGINIREGVYFYFPGPQFETPAEIRAARILGGDAVGMSTVFETITAAHCNMKVLGISLMTNMAAGVLDVRLDHVDVMEAANKAADGLKKLVLTVLPSMVE